jgi:streptogramin lyase
MLFLLVKFTAAVTTTTLATEAVCDAFQKPPLINSSCTKPQWSWSGAYLATIGIFGTPGSSAQHFSSPLGIFIDQYDNLFVADSGNHRVQKFLPNSKTGITVAGGNGQGNAVNQLNNPTNIFVDVDGNLYISDSGNSRVQKWLLNSRQGITVVNMSSTPGGIFVNRQGDIYVSEIYGQKVMKYPMNSDVGTVVASNLRRPRGIFVDECDAVYVADDLDHCIYKFIKGNTTGVVVAGVKGISSFWPYTQTVNLNSPSYVTVDQYGNMYLLDSSDARIQRVSKKDGQMTTIGGRTTANNQNNPISMDHPIGMAFDSKSNLYISDSLDRVQKFEFIGGDLYC